MKTEIKTMQQRTSTSRRSSSAPDWNTLVARAITEDQNRNYETALLLYRTCIGMMLDDLEEGKKKLEKGKRKQLKLTVKQLLRRAEELQEYLSSSKLSERLNTSNDLCIRVPSNPPSEGEPDRDNNSNNNCCGKEAQGEKEWGFKFDLRFDMRSKIKTPSPTPSPTPSAGEEGGGGGLLSPIVNIVKMMGHT